MTPDQSLKEQGYCLSDLLDAWVSRLVRTKLTGEAIQKEVRMVVSTKPLLEEMG